MFVYDVLINVSLINQTLIYLFTNLSPTYLPANLIMILARSNTFRRDNETFSIESQQILKKERNQKRDSNLRLNAAPWTILPFLHNFKSR